MQYLEKYYTNIHQTYTNAALWDRHECITFFGSKGKGSVQIVGFGGGVEPPNSFEWPPSSGKFQPPRGRGCWCNPPSSYHSLSMNGLFLIITRPPSTTMHCIPCVRSFGYLLVIKINFSAKQSTKICLFKIKNFGGEGTAPSHRGIEEGPIPVQRTACMPQLDLPTSYGTRPPSCFWTIWALDKGHSGITYDGTSTLWAEACSTSLSTIKLQFLVLLCFWFTEHNGCDRLGFLLSYVHVCHVRESLLYILMYV